jgi:hypothetical protein
MIQNSDAKWTYQTTAKTTRTRRPPHELFLVRGWTTSTSAQYVPVPSKKMRTEDHVPSMLPRQGGDQLSPCLYKAAQWLLATPLKIGWTVQGAR